MSRSKSPHRSVPSRQFSLGSIVLIGLCLAGYVLLRPTLERSLGIELPGLLDQPQSETSEAPGPATNLDDPTVELGPLTDAGRGVQESTAGLRYGRGSAHGTRLAHVMYHAKDQPNRPGKHGVFDGDQKTVLAVIDEAYLIAQRADRRTRTEHDDGRTIHTVDLGRRIGCVGGQAGNQRGKPATNRVRLVLEGRNVITAFPY